MPSLICLYPRVFPDLAAHDRTYSDTSILPTSIFFFGPDLGVEHPVEIELGKTLIVKLLAVGEPHADGMRTVFFELNGQPREVEVADRSLASSVREVPMADPSDPNQVGSPLPGLMVGVWSRRRRRAQGAEADFDRIDEDGNDDLCRAPGRVAKVLAVVGRQVKTGELLVKLSPGDDRAWRMHLRSSEKDARGRVIG